MLPKFDSAILISKLLQGNLRRILNHGLRGGPNLMDDERLLGISFTLKSEQSLVNAREAKFLSGEKSTKRTKNRANKDALNTLILS